MYKRITDKLMGEKKKMGRKRGNVPAPLSAARAAAKKISRWAQYQNQPWGRLMMSVVETAILDLASPEHQASATQWFQACDNNSIVLAIGLNAAGMRRVLRQAGLYGARYSAHQDQRIDLAA